VDARQFLIVFGSTAGIDAERREAQRAVLSDGIEDVGGSLSFAGRFGDEQRVSGRA